MFSKVSRYRNVPVVTALDAEGRQLSATDIRLLPAVTGTFLHTVTAGDRLDQLGYQYYGQPLQWWNICDGNPQFLAPLAMLGHGTIVSTSFPVSIGGTPPWSVLLAGLRGTLGVEDVRIVESAVLVAHPVLVSGQTIATYVEQVSWAVVVRHNRLNVTAGQLASAIEAAGFEVGPFADIGQSGSSIVIPPKPIG